MREKLYTVKQASEILGVHPKQSKNGTGKEKSESSEHPVGEGEFPRAR